MEDKNLRELIDELNKAETALQDAISSEDQARRIVTSCLNIVNGLQKAIDKKIEQMKSTASSRTDWKARKGINV